MIYVMGDIHGAYDAYMHMKKVLNIGPDDQLYILGDVLDGNKLNPAACLRLLEDIIRNDNITCLMGNHEYEHMCAIFEDDWDTELLFSRTFGGKPLYDYMRRHLGKAEMERYAEYIEGNMPQIDSFIFGNNYVYLAHGSVPVGKTEPEDIAGYAMCDILDPTQDYTDEVKRVMGFFHMDVPDGMNVITITGHTPVKYLYRSMPGLYEKLYPCYKDKIQRPLIYGNNICMDCGCRGSSIGTRYDGFMSDLAVLALNPEDGSVNFYSYHDCKEVKIA